MKKAFPYLVGAVIGAYLSPLVLTSVHLVASAGVSILHWFA